ncbi:hypothetical protein [Halobacillus andaensis]|uniref:hypothetical protein n=1 Tax=Halobacillus andaensis TaxID=1176239 RepID=UPI003D7447AD
MEPNTIFEWFSFLAIPPLISVILTTWLGKIYAGKVLEKEKRRYQEEMAEITASFEKELEVHKDKLEKDNILFNRYSEHQFRLYNELYSSLFDLKLSADLLWDNADLKRLTDFSKQLYETRNTIEKRALLIEDGHYERLKTIIDILSEFKNGKGELIRIKDIKDKNNFSRLQVHDLITNNEKYKEEYFSLFEELRRLFKNQLIMVQESR